MRKRLRIFISSPSDVNEERLRAHLVIQKLARDYARFFEIEAYLWEHEPMLASGHFQDAIEPPSASDVVVLILYSRLGTPLPERTAVRPYAGIDGRAPVTGTEWEFEEALAANRATGAPDLLAYRRSGDPGLSLTDPARRAEQEKQWQGLEAFWRRHFENAGMFLAGSSRFESVEEFDKRLEADLTALIERRIAQQMSSGANAEETRWLKGSPFRGLDTYEFEDAEIFFGRDAQTRLALTRLQAASDHGCAFLLLLGASGSGKSSLARAGILPAIFVPRAIPGVGAWRRVVFRAGDGGDPVRRLALALAEGDPAKGVGLPEILSAGANPDALAGHLAASADDPTFPFRLALDRVADDLRKARRMLPHETARLVILVDQIEELFTRGIDPERRDAFLRIMSALARSGQVWVVATMRNDLWHRASECKPLLDLVEAGARVDLPRPDGAEVIEIIRRPAAAAGLAFDVDSDSGVALDAVIARAAAEEPGVLPLLSVLLDTLYERDIASPRAGAGRSDVLTFETYRSLGELKGAIAERAEQALAGLRERDPEAAAALPRVLRALVTVSASGDAITSRPARLSSFPEGGPEARLIAAFSAADARLLVTSAQADGAELRLAHEALLENWPAAREQVQRDRRDLETRARIETLYRRWRDAPEAEKKRALLRGLNLAEASDLSARWSVDPQSDFGGYVRASARAERLRRSWFAATAAALALVFATIAGFAAIESRRAEREAVSARSAEQAERSARESAVQERAEAVRQRDRADVERDRAQQSEARAVEALRETRRQTARTLAAQVESAVATQEFRRALTLAVQAGQLEREALQPGAPSTSEPALLRAMADVRQVLHIQRPFAWPYLEYAFLGDTKLVVAAAGSGIVITDLAAPETKALLRIALPADFRPTHLAALPRENQIVVTSDRRLQVFDATDGRLVKEYAAPGRITALDAHEATRRLALTTPNALLIVDLASGTLSEPVAVAVGVTAIGQVRFTRGGDAVMLSVGSKVMSFKPETRQWSEQPVAELDPALAGLDKPIFEDLLAKALFPLVHVRPDLTRDRLLLMGASGLVAVASDGRITPFARENVALRLLGASFVDSGRSGQRREAVAVAGLATDATHDTLTARFINDDGKLLVFEQFTVSASDATGIKSDECKVSQHVSFMVCHYWNRSQEGLLAFRLMGGAHRFERAFGRTQNDSWGLLLSEAPDAPLVVDKDGVHVRQADRFDTVGQAPEGWSFVGAVGSSLVARSASGEQMQVVRYDRAARTLTPAVAPLNAKQFFGDAAHGRIAFAEAGRLSVYDLSSGRRLFAVPGLDEVRGAGFSADGQRLGVVTDSQVYVFRADSGKLDGSVPLGEKLASFAFDPALRRLVFVGDNRALRTLDIASGTVAALGEGLTPPSMVRWAADGSRLLVGHRNGGVTALSPEGKTLWTIASPLGEAFSEENAWPGQPPKGLVTEIALSSDGAHFGVLRQDWAAADLHEAATGRRLTSLSTPWAWGVPVRMTLGPAGHVLIAWALHPMAPDKPAHVSLHVLPFGLDAALSAARARLKSLEVVYTPGLEATAR
ncbi:MAG: hypothetical protein IT538_01615 [Variibacter sp.]|nr:hypothetical protein [Variibacter sp.]